MNGELPGLRIGGSSGYFDDAGVARHTIDPNDTAQNIKAQGFASGYEQTFSSAGAPSSLTLSVRVYLWDAPASAKEFMGRFVQDSERLKGSQIQSGVTLKEFQKLNAPKVGEDTVAVRLTASVAALQGAEINTTTVLWRRGSLVGTVAVLALDSEDRTSTVARLAQRMNQRVDEVLAGKIAAAPLVPTSSPPVVPQRGTPPAPPPGFNLKAMMPTLEELPAGLALQRDGTPERTDALQSYQRSFRAGETVIRLGSSEMAEIHTLVELYASAEVARRPVDFVKSLSPEAMRQLAQQGSPTVGGSTPEGSTMELLDLTQVGDVSVGLVSRSRSPVGDVEGQVVHFVRGQIRAQLFVVGPAGKITRADLTSLAQLFDRKIRQHSP